LRALDPVQLIWQAKDAEFKLVTAFSNASLVGTPWDNIIDQVNNKAHAFLAAQVDDVKAELASVLAHVVAKTSKIEADVQSNPAKWLKPDVWTDPEQMAFVTEPNNRQMTPYVAGEHYFFGYWQEIECTDLLTDTVQTEFAHINAGKMWMVAPGDMLLLEGTTLDGEQKKLKGENLHLQVPALIQPWLDFYGTLTKDRLETPKEGFAESYECAFDPPIQYDPLQMGEGNYVMFAGVQVHLQVSGEITVGDQFHGKFAEKVGAYAGFSIPLNEFTHVVNVSGVPRRWMVRPNDSRPLNEVAVWQVENWVGPFGVDSFLRSMQRQHESDVGVVQMNCKSLCGKILENVFDDPTLGPSSGFNGGPSPLEILNLSRISEFAQNTFDGPLRPLGIDDMPTLLEGYSYAAEKGTVVSSNFNPATVDPKLEGVVPTGTFPFQCGDDGLFGIKGYRDVFKNPFVHETGNDARQLYPTAIYIDSVAARACMQCLNEFTTAELFGTGGSPPGADGTGGSIDYSTALSRIAINARLDKWFTTPVIPSTHQLLDSIAPIPPPPTPSPGWSWTFSDEILKVVEFVSRTSSKPISLRTLQRGQLATRDSIRLGGQDHVIYATSALPDGINDAPHTTLYYKFPVCEEYISGNGTATDPYVYKRSAFPKEFWNTVPPDQREVETENMMIYGTVFRLDISNLDNVKLDTAMVINDVSLNTRADLDAMFDNSSNYIDYIVQTGREMYGDSNWEPAPFKVTEVDGPEAAEKRKKIVADNMLIAGSEPTAWIRPDDTKATASKPDNLRFEQATVTTKDGKNLIIYANVEDLICIDADTATVHWRKHVNEIFSQELRDTRAALLTNPVLQALGRDNFLFPYEMRSKPSVDVSSNTCAVNIYGYGTPFFAILDMSDGDVLDAFDAYPDTSNNNGIGNIWSPTAVGNEAFAAVRNCPVIRTETIDGSDVLVAYCCINFSVEYWLKNLISQEDRDALGAFATAGKILKMILTGQRRGERLWITSAAPNIITNVSGEQVPVECFRPDETEFLTYTQLYEGMPFTDGSDNNNPGLITSGDRTIYPHINGNASKAYTVTFENDTSFALHATYNAVDASGNEHTFTGAELIGPLDSSNNPKFTTTVTAELTKDYKFTDDPWSRYFAYSMNYFGAHAWTDTPVLSPDGKYISIAHGNPQYVPRDEAVALNAEVENLVAASVKLGQGAIEFEEFEELALASKADLKSPRGNRFMGNCVVVYDCSTGAIHQRMTTTSFDSWDFRHVGGLGLLQGSPILGQPNNRPFLYVPYGADSDACGPVQMDDGYIGAASKSGICLVTTISDSRMVEPEVKADQDHGLTATNLPETFIKRLCGPPGVLGGANYAVATDGKRIFTRQANNYLFPEFVIFGMTPPPGWTTVSGEIIPTNTQFITAMDTSGVIVFEQAVKSKSAHPVPVSVHNNRVLVSDRFGVEVFSSQTGVRMERLRHDPIPQYVGPFGVADPEWVLAPPVCKDDLVVKRHLQNGELASWSVPW